MESNLLSKDSVIGSGPDSTVYLSEDKTTVYKDYSASHTTESIEWYAHLTQGLAKLGEQKLGEIVDTSGKSYKITCIVVPHVVCNEMFYVLTAPYIAGPTLGMLLSKQSEDMISMVDDEKERDRILSTINVRLSSGKKKKVFREVIYEFCYELNLRLKEYLENYINNKEFFYPGDMNIKFRMPQDDTIQLIVTDLFADIFSYYKSRECIES